MEKAKCLNAVTLLMEYPKTRNYQLSSIMLVFIILLNITINTAINFY